MEEWVEQLQNSVTTLDRLEAYINLTPEEEKAISVMGTKWGSTPYFVSLMDPDDPKCPIRQQVLPSLKEKEPGWPL